MSLEPGEEGASGASERASPSLRMPPAFRALAASSATASVESVARSEPGQADPLPADPEPIQQSVSTSSRSSPGRSSQVFTRDDMSPATSISGGRESTVDHHEPEDKPIDDDNDSLETRKMSSGMVRNSIEVGLNAENTHSDRDRYGFRKKTNYLSEEEYDEWWGKYRPYVQRRKQKWVKLMKDNGIYMDNDQPVRFPPSSDKRKSTDTMELEDDGLTTSLSHHFPNKTNPVKRYIRKGIPAEWRGNAWFWYARGHEVLNTHPGLYDRLCKQTRNLKNSDTELIERDLNRTFPDNIYFRGEPTASSTSIATECPLIQSLRHVLTAFSVYQPKIGYCQSLNFIAGMLLLFMDEEKAFWMLVIITQRYLPGVHEVNLEGVNVDQGVLMLCVRESLPHMWDRLGVNFEGNHYDNILSKLPPITLCTASWFMSAYISILPTETMLRVWDCFFFEGSKIFFRVALTILMLTQPSISTVSDQMEMFQIVQNFPKRIIDPATLLENCFRRRNGFGHISQDEIVRRRKFVAERRSLANAAAVRRNANMSSSASAHELPTSDLEEFRKLKPDSKGQHLQMQISRRLRSLRVSRRDSIIRG